MEKLSNPGRFIELPNNKNTDLNYWADQTKSLLAQQKENWPLLNKNYEGLKKVITREFEFDGFIVKVQFNPERIKSSAAAVDSESIKARKCFLCPENLPGEQKGILYGKSLAVLCNPYPIFNEHFTIARIKHAHQQIAGNFDDMLNLAKDFAGHYSIFYNGPECGASAPDHMHFQAGSLGLMPIEHEYERMKNVAIAADDKIQIYGAENYLRYFLLLESSNRGELQYAIKIILSTFKKIQKNAVEPLLNIITFFEGGKWRVIIFPRFKHRPKQFFAEDESKMLLSPAAVDLGGVLIVPREEDFNRINRDVITDVFGQVTVCKEFFEYFKKKIREVYSVQS